MKPDILYICRDGNNEELRFSMRSLQNLPHGRVFVSGGRPAWFSSEVTYIPVHQEVFSAKTKKNKIDNVRRNLQAALDDERLSENFLLFNDDFFITGKVDEVPVYNFGTYDHFLKCVKSPKHRESGWMLGEKATTEWAKQFTPEPLCYCLHIPLPCKKSLFKQTLDVMPERLGGYPPHIRTAYGNHHGIGGTTRRDVKINAVNNRAHYVRRDGRRTQVNSGGPTKHTPFCSTSDRAFLSGRIGGWLQSLFPDPSPYERG